MCSFMVAVSDVVSDVDTSDVSRVVWAGHRAGMVGFGPKRQDMRRTEYTVNGTIFDRFRQWVWRVTGMAEYGYCGWFVSGETKKNKRISPSNLATTVTGRWVADTTILAFTIN
ncbi:hypothetical protein TSUD_293260 [Trifolium subterraneum]|uniref:Uncharacterized protein n=1 Tax=Trifolium subterraneum TaxID=3900 RepID=A0A2Z6M8Q8_TRISU|nr:hypothetical protein TSUD_293260 [Trifolium subterraneum]